MIVIDPAPPVAGDLEVKSPPAPLILHPEDGDGVGVAGEGDGAIVRLSWAPPASGRRYFYQVEVAEDREFTRLVSCLLTSDCRQLPVWIPVRGMPYHWRLRAVDDLGRIGAWSASAGFHVGVEVLPEPPPGVPDQVGAMVSLLRLFRRVAGTTPDTD